MKSIIKLVALFTLTCLLFTNCEKDKIYIEKEYNWKSHPNFEYEKAYQMNSFSTDTFMVFYGLHGITTVGYDKYGSYYDDITGEELANFIPYPRNSNNLTFPITSEFIVKYEEFNSNFQAGIIEISPSILPNHQDFSIIVSIPDIDEKFGEYDFISLPRGNCIAANDNNQILIPYKTNEWTINLLLVDLYTTDYWVPQNSIDTIKTKVIETGDRNYTRYIHSVGSDFYLSTDNKTYIINPEGSIVRELDYQFCDIITMGDSLFAVCQNLNSYDYEWLNSFDMGESWNKVVDLSDMYSSINYTVVNNRILGYRYAQIWEIIPLTDGVEFRELDNDGLDGHYITSIKEFKNKVYVSTLSGVFYKTVDELFLEKVIDEPN